MKKTIIYYLLAMSILFSIDAFSLSAPSIKTYTLKYFDAILVQDAIEVILKKSNENKVQVETDAEYQDNVLVQLNNEKLTLKVKENANNVSIKKIFSETPKIKIYIYYQQLNEIFLSGASSISNKEAISTEKLLVLLSGASSANIISTTKWLSVNCTGASKCTVSGSTEKLNLKSSGASNIKSNNLISNNAEVEVNGASNVEVFAQDNLQIVATGASSVKYKSLETTKISKNISGASTITKI